MGRSEPRVLKYSDKNIKGISSKSVFVVVAVIWDLAWITENETNKQTKNKVSIPRYKTK